MNIMLLLFTSVFFGFTSGISLDSTSELETPPPRSWTKSPGCRGGKKIYSSYETVVISSISRWYVLALIKRCVLARKCHQK